MRAGDIQRPTSKEWRCAFSVSQTPTVFRDRDKLVRVGGSGRGKEEG